MSTPSTDRTDGMPERSGRPGPAAAPGGPAAGVARPRTEPVLAVTAAVAALLADTLDDSGDLWVVLDIAALLVTGVAVAVLVRGFAAARGRPSLTEAATAAVTASISGAVWLLAGHGPQARVGSLLLATAAVMGAVLTVLVILGAAARYRREDAGPAPEPGDDFLPPAGRFATLTTLAAAAVAAIAVARDVMMR